MRSRSTAFVAAVLLLLVAGSAAAQTGKGSTPNGRPFQALQGQLDTLQAQMAAIQQQVTTIAALQAQLDALAVQVSSNSASIEQVRAYNTAQDALLSSLGGAIVALETSIAGTQADVATLQLHDSLVDSRLAALDAQWRGAEARLAEHASSLQALVDADRALQEYAAALAQQIAFVTATASAAAADVQSLQIELTQLRAALALKQTQIAGACLAGSSIRQVYSDGSVTCELDDVVVGGGALSVATSTFVSSGLIGPGGFAFVTAQCPSGYLPLSGGYAAPMAFNVFYSAPEGANGWAVGVRNTTGGSAAFSASVRCGRVE